MSDIKSNTDSLQFYLLNTQRNFKRASQNTPADFAEQDFNLQDKCILLSLVAVSTNQILMQIGFSLAKHVLFFARPLQELL